MTLVPERHGPLALITGAARAVGLGAAFARELARQGMGLVLVDIARDELFATSESLRNEFGVEVLPVVLDLGTDFLPDLLAALGVRRSEIGLLICNHMTTPLGLFHEQPLDVVLGALNVNARAYTILSHTFAGDMAARGRGGIIVVTSGASIVPQTHNLPYCANKSYQRALGDVMHAELKPLGVDVLTLIGPLMNSFDTSSFPAAMVMDTNDVARQALAALGNKASLLPGFLSKVAVFAQDSLMSRQKAIVQGGEYIVRAQAVNQA